MRDNPTKPKSNSKEKEQIMTKPKAKAKAQGVKFPTSKEMSMEFPRLLNRVKYLMAENTEKGNMIATLQDAYITQNCRINHLNRKLNKLLGHGSVDFPNEEEGEGVFIVGTPTMSVAGDEVIFKPVELKHNGIVGWFKRRFNRDNAPTTILWILILGMFPLMFTPIARIYEWLPNLLSYIGGCA